MEETAKLSVPLPRGGGEKTGTGGNSGETPAPENFNGNPANQDSNSGMDSISGQAAAQPSEKLPQPEKSPEPKTIEELTKPLPIPEKKSEPSQFDYYFKSDFNYYPDKRKDWNNYCENPDEEFFSDFAEFFDSCIQAEDGCSCTMKNSYPEALKSGGKLTFRKHPDGYYDLSLTGSNEIFRLVTGNYQADFPEEITSANIDDFRSINKNNGMITFSKDPQNKECNTELQMIKVCAVSTNRLFLMENTATGMFEQTPLTVRFAFTPPNTPPPDVKGVGVQDLNRSMESVVISWLKSPAYNVVNYSIYQNYSDFSGQKSEDVRAVIQPITVEVKDALEAKSLNLHPECTKSGNKQCIFELVADTEEEQKKIPPNPGTLIYESGTNRYHYIKQVKDEEEAFFGVTAVNRKGLESVKFSQTPAGTSYDDIPPGQISITKFSATQSDSQPSIQFSVPSINIDGSPLDASKKVLMYDLMKKCPDGNQVIGSYSVTKVLQAAIPEIQDECELKAVAKKQVVARPLAKFTPDLSNPYHESDTEIINYLLE